MREAAGTIPGAQLYVTGQSAVEHDLDPVMSNDLKVGELFIAIPIAMVILIFVFGSLAFLLPFMLAAAAIPVTLGILWIFANFMELSTYLTNLVMLIGLGIAVDYSLLMVYRYREEHRAGLSREDAVVRTMETAGRAVIFSGTAVAIGLALMLAMPLPFMRGFGLAGLLIPLVSVLAAMTLLPVLLYWLEDRLDRVRLIPKSVQERRWDHERGFWARLAGAIMRRPVLFATGAVLLLLAAAGTRHAAEPDAGLEHGRPAEPRGGSRAERPRGRGRRRRAGSERGRGRHRQARRGERRARAGGDQPAPGRPLDRPRGRARRLRAPGGAVRRCDASVPAHADHRQARIRPSACSGLRGPASRRPHPRRRVPGRRRGARGRWPAGRRGLPGPDVLRVPLARPGGAPADLRTARARVQVAAPPAEGDHHEPARDRSRLRAARRRLQVRRGRAVRHPAVRPDRGLDPGVPVRDALRALDGLRGVPRVPDARGVGQDPRQRSRP